MTADNAGEKARREVIAQLAALSPIEYDQVRVDEAGRLGVRVATLDDEVAHWRKTQGREPVQGQRSRWPVPTPSPDPVNGAELLAGIADFVSTYVHLPIPAASTVALWIVMTWLHDRLDLSPFLHLTSPTRRCGKSALLEVILRAVFHSEGDPPALPTRSILDALNQMESRPWSNCEKGKPLTAQGLAKLLKPFRVAPTTVRLAGGHILKGYKYDDLDPLWKVYCPGVSHPMSVTSVTTLETSGSSNPQPVTPDGSVADGSAPKPPETRGVTGVTGTGGAGDQAIDDAGAGAPSPTPLRRRFRTRVSEPASRGPETET